MIELRDRLRLAFESDLELGVLRKFRRENLDGHAAIETCIARFEYLPHPTRPERRDDFVRPESGAGGNGHGSVRAIVPVVIHLEASDEGSSSLKLVK